MYKLQPIAFYYDWKFFASASSIDEEVIQDDLYDRVDWEGPRIAPKGIMQVLDEEENIVSKHSFHFQEDYSSPVNQELLAEETYAALLVRAYVSCTDPYCCTEIQEEYDPSKLAYSDGSLYYGDEYVQADGDSSTDFYFYYQHGLPVGKEFLPETLKNLTTLHEIEEIIASSDMPRMVDTSKVDALSAATEVAKVLRNIVIESLDELKECTQNERSYKVRPDYGPSKFYLDWSKPEGRGGQMGYDSSVQSLITWILYEDGIMQNALTDHEFEEFKARLAEDPDQLWTPADGNRRDWMNELYKYSIEYLAYTLDQNGLDVESFIQYSQYTPGKPPVIQIAI